MIDGLVLLPLTIPLLAAWIVTLFHRFQTLAKTATPGRAGPPPLRGSDLAAFYGLGFLIMAAQLVITVVYEALLTATTGRTLGKRWLRIRPLRSDGSTLSTSRCWGRAAAYAGMSVLSIIGLLDQIWQFWDPMRQCLHDKATDTIVVHD